MRLKSVDGVTTSNLFNVPVSRITVDQPFNVRTESAFTGESFATLRESIRANGVRNPLIVRVDGDSIILVSGHRRLAVARELGADIVPTLPCVAERRGTTEIDRIASLVTDNSGEPLGPMEYATVCARLRAAGVNVDESALKLGCTTQHVRCMLILADAPEPVRDMVARGAISPTLAYETVAKEGAEKAVTLLLAAMKDAAESGKTKITPKVLRASADRSPRLAAAGNAAETVKAARVEYTASKRSVFAGSVKMCIAENGKLAAIIAAALNKTQPALEGVG